MGVLIFAGDDLVLEVNVPTESVELTGVKGDETIQPDLITDQPPTGE